MKSLSHSRAFAALAVVLVLSGSVLAQSRRNWRQQERQIRNSNAALAENGGRVQLELLESGSGKDKHSSPGELCDANVHSRCVTWGPVRYRIDLVDTLNVSGINFICSDGGGEASAKDVLVKLSDGRELKKTLDVVRPPRRGSLDKFRQTLEIDAKISYLEVTILNFHPGAEDKNGKARMWGGLGELEVITTDDLSVYRKVPDYNADAPSYLRAQSPRSDYSDVSVTMPEPIALGVRPGIYMTAAEIKQLGEKIPTADRGKEMLDSLFSGCDAWLDKEIVFPDPKKPAQLTDRNCPAARAHDKLAKMAGWFGWAYRLSGDERYAAKAHEILVGYAKLYPNDYKEHKGVNGNDSSKVMAQRLSEAMWILPLIQSYDMVADSESFSDADRKLVEKDLIRHCVSFINRKTSAADTVASRDRENPDWRNSKPSAGGGPIGNWTNFYNAAYIQAGIVLGDQNWIDIGAANTRYMLARGIGDDGMWGEGAIGYQQFARNALIDCVEPLARKGIDLWSFMDCRFKNLFDSAIKYAYPDATAPGINDSGRTPIGGSWQAMAFDYGYLRYGDENYGAVVNAAPRQIFQSTACYYPTVIYDELPEKPMRGFGSMIFDNLGYAILRGTEGPSESYLLMDYGRHGGTHGHMDKLNLIMFADGDELAGEPQGYRYENPLHRAWTRQSVAHWTVASDMHSQKAATGKLLCFADGGDIKIMRGNCGEAFVGTALDRTVVQLPGYVLDVYRCWGNVSHSYDYPLCFRGTLDALDGVGADALSPMSEASPAYRNILTSGAVELTNQWSGHWQRYSTREAQSGKLINDVKVLVNVDKPSELYCGVVPGDRHQAVVRTTGRDVTFTTLIDPYMATDAIGSVTSEALDGDIPARVVKVAADDGSCDIIIVRYDTQGDSTPGGVSSYQNISTDALVAVVRLDAAGYPRQIGFTGGSFVSVGDQRLQLPEAGISFWSAKSK